MPVLPILLNFPISWWQSANLDQKSYSRILDQSVELTLLIALIAASFDAPTVDVIFAGREMVGFCVPSFILDGRIKNDPISYKLITAF